MSAEPTAFRTSYVAFPTRDGLTVAGQLRVSTMTVYRLLKAGQLASVRVGKSYRVREEDVDRYLASTYTQAG